MERRGVSPVQPRTGVDVPSRNAAKVGKQTQPQRGERIQPTAQAVGKEYRRRTKPQRGERIASMHSPIGATANSP
jgi:hypothetical protein